MPKFAFTLAELLIAIGIIGIVSALTIPTLYSNYRKHQTVTRLKKAISVWNNAYKLSREEIGEPTQEELKTLPVLDIYNKYYAPYISGIAKYCHTSPYCGYKQKHPYTYIKGQGWNFNFYYPVNMGIISNDGMFYAYQVRSSSGNLDLGFLVDINGLTKPNKFGIDVFSLDQNNGFQPNCSTYTKSKIDTSCAATGECCAEKIRRAGWTIDKSYPWK
jgi:prepilin-type N-terminal cleavage/methylation domain-containing protein